MCRFALSMILIASTSILSAQHPDRRNQPVWPIIDVIGPVGNNLPPSHRRTYNRPTYIGGKIAYWIAPASREAMAWQAAYQAGAYRNHLPRLDRHYFFPKPWEAIQIGTRTPRERPELEGPYEMLPNEFSEDDGPERQPVIVSPIERERVANDDDIRDIFGSIIVVDPASFSAASVSSEASPAPQPKPSAEKSVGSASEVRDTLQRLRSL